MPNTRDLIVKGTDVRIIDRVGGLPAVKIHNPDVQSLLLLIHTDDLLEYIHRWIAMEEIYPTPVLEKWAEANGYVKATDNE